MAHRRRGTKLFGSNLRIPNEQRLSLIEEEVWLAKHKKTSVVAREAQIKCQNKIHKIRFEFPGRVTLINHPDCKAEITMIGLGGDKPECLMFMEKWKKNPEA
ncbi:MAG: hypothetical protein L0Y56_10125, partial [Nitrospira sp.]|nr:hypothetical protein [Nitrospira sp.]